MTVLAVHSRIGVSQVLKRLKAIQIGLFDSASSVIGWAFIIRCTTRSNGAGSGAIFRYVRRSAIQSADSLAELNSRQEH